MGGSESAATRSGAGCSPRAERGCASSAWLHKEKLRAWAEAEKMKLAYQKHIKSELSPKALG